MKMTDASSPIAGRRAGWIAWALLAPLLLWLVVFVVAPTAIMFVYSFCERGDLGGVEYRFTTQHYARMTSASDLVRLLISGAGQTLLIFPVAIALSAVAAKALRWFADQTDTLTGGVSIFAGVLIAQLAFALLPGTAALRDNPLTSTIIAALIVAAACGTACLLIPPRWFRRWSPPFVLPAVTFVVLLIFHTRAAAIDSAATYVKVFVYSIDYAAVSTGICVFAGYPAAYFIARSSTRWRTILLVAVMIPFWANFLIRTYAWITILSHDGLLNAAMTSIGIFREPHEMLFTGGAVMVGLVYTYLPFMILPIYGSIEKLDESMIEASCDLGASPLKTFARVILPLTWPGIAAGILLVFIPAVGQFAINDLLGGKREPIIGNVIENQFGAAMNKPFGAALGMVLLGGFAASALLFRKQPEAG